MQSICWLETLTGDSRARDGGRAFCMAHGAFGGCPGRRERWRCPWPAKCRWRRPSQRASSLRRASSVGHRFRWAGPRNGEADVERGRTLLDAPLRVPFPIWLSVILKQPRAETPALGSAQKTCRALLVPVLQTKVSLETFESDDRIKREGYPLLAIRIK